MGTFESIFPFSFSFFFSESKFASFSSCSSTEKYNAEVGSLSYKHTQRLCIFRDDSYKSTIQHPNTVVSIPFLPGPSFSKGRFFTGVNSNFEMQLLAIDSS